MFRFKELLELWRSDNSLTQALNDSYTMLDSTHEMFRASVKSLRESDNGEIGPNIYEMDQRVNRYEKKVRRQVLQYLAVTGSAIMPGLVLTSIVIDIERIGDYTKNIKDLAVTHPKRLRCDRFEDDVVKIEKAVDSLFEGGIPALKESDKAAAHKLLDDNLWIVKSCDEIVDALVLEKESTLGAGEAVATALYVRYLKRIAAHMRNIITSIVNPFESIGFREDEDPDE